MATRVLIVDDEALARDVVRHYLGKWPDVEIVGECATGANALRDIQRLKPDLVFLDIQMPELGGLAVLERLPAESRPLIVFVTAYDEYAIRAFDAQALDYLLKPFDQARFDRAMRRALEEIRHFHSCRVAEGIRELLDQDSRLPNDSRRPSRLGVKDRSKTVLLKVDEIDWIQAARDYVSVHSGGRSYLVDQSLTMLEKQLDPAVFQRIHRSTIVNLERIKELQTHNNGEYFAVLEDGSRLKVSRTYSAKLAAVLNVK